MASGWEVSGAAPLPSQRTCTHCGCLVSGITSIMEGACVPWSVPLPIKHVHQKLGWLATSATSPR